MCVRAILDQEDALAAAERGDALDVERDVAADVHEERRARTVALRAFASKSANDAQRSSRLQSTNTTSAPAACAASGVAMNVLEGHSTVAPRTSANSSAASAAPDQLAIATAGSPFHALPGRLERLHDRSLRPALRREDLVPERVQAGAIALVEADCERAEAFGMRHARPSTGAYWRRRRCTCRVTLGPVTRHAHPRRDRRRTAGRGEVVARPPRAAQQATGVATVSSARRCAHFRKSAAWDGSRWRAGVPRQRSSS